MFNFSGKSDHEKAKEKRENALRIGGTGLFFIVISIIAGDMFESGTRITSFAIGAALVAYTVFTFVRTNKYF